MNNGLTPIAKIFVAGHTGLAGSALLRRLISGGYSNIITRSHSELDLTNQSAVRQFFECDKPDYVFLAAAKVGGIFANNTCPADFIYQNLTIETNVIHAAYQSGAKKLLFLGSSCCYPRLAPQPMREEFLLTGSLEPTNEAYAIAKIAGIKLCAYYHKQYGVDFLSVMPTNLYGPGDNYNQEEAHVIPALIRKMHEAKLHGEPEVIVWGSGTPRREFLFSDDVADACVFLMENYTAAQLGELINIGTGEDVTISEVAQLIAETIGYDGKLVFDSTKPDGAPRKLLDVSKLYGLGWKYSTSLIEGLRKTYLKFRDHS